MRCSKDRENNNHDTDFKETRTSEDESKDQNELN